ncbi:MAG: hypothetical protein C0608_07295 [Deltaproteobacteria bacterium]|nr:MAG: hypothetical protein C0608_07295 [Deltaproteobacteria bacterium]
MLSAELRKPKKSDYEALTKLIPNGKLLTAPEAIERYSRDESTRAEALPWAVVIPSTEEEVAQVLSWANKGYFPIVTRGAGTGVAGGSVALGGGVVLSLERLNEILSIDSDNLTITCQPGVITEALQREVETLGLFYPPDPASADSCSIGGNVAVGAGGARAVKYGTTRDYVLGMRVALAEGRIISLGGKNVKDASGFSLLQLMVGAEGTLGVITEVTLRLIAKPKRRVSMLLPFKDLADAARTVHEITLAGVLPAVAEFIDDIAIEAAGRHLSRSLPCEDKANAFAFICLDGDEAKALERQMTSVGAIAKKHNALDILAAIDEGQQERLWESRRTLGTAMKGLSPVIGKADVVVPRGAVPELVTRVKEIGRALSIDIACFGHAGDGNVHVNILRRDLSENLWSKGLKKAMSETMSVVIELGGRPSGEHGIGALKREELENFLGAETLALMRGIKNVFDPKGILNPGKVI